MEEEKIKKELVSPVHRGKLSERNVSYWVPLAASGWDFGDWVSCLKAEEITLPSAPEIVVLKRES